MPVTLNVEELQQGRTAVLRKLLAPLVRGTTVPCRFVPSGGQNMKIIAAHAGGPTVDGNYRDWWFETFVKRVWARYHEIWYPVTDEKTWTLERAYLTIGHVEVTTRTRVEVMCVHCDPSTNPNEPLWPYKCAPHVHVLRADPPIPRSHIPLNLCHLQIVLGSVGSLNAAMRSAIRIVAEQVIALYDDG